MADSDGPQFYLTLDKALPVGFTLQVGATTLSSQDASIREFSSGATQYGWATNQGAILADVDTWRSASPWPSDLGLGYLFTELHTKGLADDNRHIRR